VRILGFILLTGVACVAAPAVTQEGGSLLSRYDLGTRSQRADLPGRLDEVSGLATTPDGRLFAHGDERAWVHEIDPETGEVGKRFMFGDQTAVGDFEGIAIVGERFFLVTSTGLLYESREGADREETPYLVTDTGLGPSCEVEGLEYHAGWDELLLLCKNSVPDRGTIVVHRLPISPDTERPAPIEIPRSELEAFGLPSAFHGSAIVWDASSGTLILVAAREEAMIEVTEDGRVVAGVKLARRRHAQAEGLAIGADGTLFIADEQNGRSARITMYYATDVEVSR
jgi:uncharacterized protein YjiK